jgi:predicted PurR-regulated permease PerM
MPNARAERSQSWTPLLVLAASLLVLYLFWRVLLVFVLAALFAFVVSPVVRLFDRKLPHIFSIISVYLIIAILLTVVVGLTAPLVGEQFRLFVDALPSYVEQARELFDGLQARYVALPASWRAVGDRALTQLEETLTRVTRETIPAVFAVLSGLVTLVFVPLLAFFMLLDYEGYKRMLIAVTPRQHRETVNDLLSCVGRSLWDFIRGEFILMAAVGTLVGLGLYLVGMPYPIVFAILAGLLEIVPNIGPTITTIVVALVGLLIHPILALEAAGITIVVQLLENTLLVPLVLGKSVGLDPVTVIFAVFLAGSLAGVIAAIIAIPLALIAKIVLLYFYAEESELPREQRGICLPVARRARPSRRPRR